MVNKVVLLMPTLMADSRRARRKNENSICKTQRYRRCKRIFI